MQTKREPCSSNVSFVVQNHYLTLTFLCSTNLAWEKPQIPHSCTKQFLKDSFRHGFLPNIDSWQVLLGTPPLVLLSTTINVKFFLKLKLEDDLLHWTHDASSSFPGSVANLLESHVTRFWKFLRIHNCTRYKQQDVNLFINYLWNLRWKNNDNKSFLKCYTKSPPTFNTVLPLFNLQR